MAAPELDAEAIAAACRRHHAKRLRLFGSALTSRFDPATSDYDFVVEFQENAPSRIRAWMGLKEELEEMTGTSVDLIIGPNFKSHRFARSVVENSRDLYAA